MTKHIVYINGVCYEIEAHHLSRAGISGSYTYYGSLEGDVVAEVTSGGVLFAVVPEKVKRV